MQGSILPLAPKVILEEGNKGVFEIEGLYSGYGQTIGNSLRRVLLSSLEGAAITAVKIEGVPHEFYAIPGVKEDVINIILNLKQIRFKLHGNEPQKATISAKGVKNVTAKDFVCPSQLELVTPNVHLAVLTSKDSELEMEILVERGLGYIPKEVLHKDKAEVGVIKLDAIFTPIRKVAFEVENMRVGERTDYNRLRLIIETDDTVSPAEAYEKAVNILISQLEAIKKIERGKREAQVEKPGKEIGEELADFSGVSVNQLKLSSRTMNALVKGGVKTVGGLTRKSESDLKSIEGLGEKSVKEIKKSLTKLNLELKD